MIPHEPKTPVIWQKLTKTNMDHDRGACISTKSDQILTWLLGQNREEWQYEAKTSQVTMTRRLYTMFLLKWGQV